eukprot:TRINITY_DN47102_c0_g1_i1.p1 TRINITY_DN47102_c0_g1~~TRINITY_DN47102_c0_g1_i1.p1  ORF type:complete len:316 (+),score=44.12 TRINITY_DN47102_c0_g1_i1:103-1050(+)
MDAKPPRAGRCVCSDGQGRDSYIVREQGCLSGRHTVVDPDAMWLLQLRGNPAANVSKAAAGKPKQGQRQQVPQPPSQDAQHRRGTRPCTANRPSRCRKSWVPMGGAPRKVMPTPRSEGHPAPKPRPPSASVRVELERAIWMGASMGTLSGASSETQSVATQIRGAVAMPRSQHLWRPKSAGCPGRSPRIAQERRLETGMQEAASNYGSSSWVSSAENRSCEDVDGPLDLKPDALRTAEADERKKHEIEMMMRKLEVRDRYCGSRTGTSNCSSEICQATTPRSQRPISAPACAGVRRNPAAIAWAVRRVPDYDPLS